MAEFDTISKNLIQKYPNDFAGFYPRARGR